MENAYSKRIDHSICLLEDVARIADTGNVYINLAKIYLQKNEWGRAVLSLNKAFAKGGIKDIKSAYILLSDAHSRLSQKRLAKACYDKALEL